MEVKNTSKVANKRTVEEECGGTETTSHRLVKNPRNESKETSDKDVDDYNDQLRQLKLKVSLLKQDHDDKLKAFDEADCSMSSVEVTEKFMKANRDYKIALNKYGFAQMELIRKIIREVSSISVMNSLFFYFHLLLGFNIGWLYDFYKEVKAKYDSRARTIARLKEELVQLEAVVKEKEADQQRLMAETSAAHASVNLAKAAFAAKAKELREKEAEFDAAT
ncbi:hypothetical protein MKW94_007415 [Papaver nudicaule]|uniref:Uncharacterized protein n=1 Tax=Papaver nudicaule TaxID=74823 RepID=A0AA41V9Q8_PAPNU|nr:hypothetical protein [Papaver nudicaule]